MLKPFYNKKGHLGKTTDEVKEAIKAAGLIPAIESGDAGKAIVANEDEDGFTLAPVGGGSSYPVIHISGMDPDFSVEESYADIIQMLSAGTPILISANDGDDFGFAESGDDGIALKTFYLNTITKAILIQQFEIVLDDVHQTVSVVYSTASLQGS